VTGEPDRGSPVRTVFIGSGAFGRESLRRLHDRDDTRLVGVVTAPPRPAGRRQRLTSTAIDEAAGQLGVTTVLRPERLRAPDAVSAVLDLEPSLIVLADYGQIVPVALLDVRHGALNLHPSLLPRHRGATPIPAAILAGDPATGVTLMRMDVGLDTGPIVAQARVELDGAETTPSLEAHLGLLGAELLGANLGPWLRGELEARPQPETGATTTRPLQREDGRLDPRRPASALERQVRAYQPWPGSFIDTPVGRLIVLRAAAEPDGPPSGTFDAGGLGAADGSRLALLEVQPAGGKPMAWEAFVRGHPGIVGSRVVASDP
jgi:methionyl-tRNA formyltransferase